MRYNLVIIRLRLLTLGERFISFLRPYNNFSVLKYTFYLEKLCFKVGLRRSVNNLLDGNEVDV